MKPDQQSNYWQRDPEDEDDVTREPEMYTPEHFESGQPLIDPNEQQLSSPIVLPEPEPTHWSANEYIHHEKNGLWFLIFGVIVLLLIALSVFILKAYTFTALVIVMAIAVIVFARRPPREINYTLSANHGLYVGEKLYPFSDFKSFGLIKDGDHHSIMLIPTKRFSPGVTVYFPEESGEEIVDIFGARLPMEERKLDVIDILVRKLRL